MDERTPVVGRGWYYGWAVVSAACVTVSAASGVRAVFGVLLVALVGALGWGRGITAGALSLNALVWACSAAPLGAALDRWGPRRVFPAAAVLAGAGLALAGATESPWQLYLGIGVLAGIGLTPLIPASQNVVVARWFTRRRGLAMGIVASGLGLGVLVLAPLTQWIMSVAGWRAGFLTIAALLLFGAAPLHALVHRRRPTGADLDSPATRPSGAAPAPGGAPAGPTVRQAMRAPRFWLLATSLLLGNAPLYFLLVHGVPHLVDVGFSPGIAAATLGLAGACTIATSVLAGYLADRWGLEATYTVGTLALVASIATLQMVQPGQDGLLVEYAILFAMGIASRQGLGPLMGAALGRGPSLGALMGILGVPTALGVGLGPGLGGWLFDAFGSYHWVFIWAYASTLGALACVWLAAPRHGLLGAPSCLVLRLPTISQWLRGARATGA